jgi:small conductance mechanosensitive channel
MDFVGKYGPLAIKALLILFIGWIVSRILTSILRRVMRKANFDPALTAFLANFAYALLMVLVVVSAIQALEVATTSFVAVLGAAGLAVGFALQGSLSNFAAGVMLILFRPFKAGDYVEAGGIAGTIEEIQIFATMMRTPDNKRIIVPNSAITGGNIVNYSANDTRRIDLVFGIGYGDDIKKAKEVLTSLVTADERILKDPAPVVAVLELGDSSVNFAVRPWVKTADYWGVYFDLTEAVKTKFDAEQISIPFPQRDIHVHQAA